MTDRVKFEQMLELLINENREKAEELFHDLIVAKSREIYENLLDDDMQVESSDDEEDEECSEEDVEEGFMGFGEFAPPTQDQSDDFLGDIEADTDQDSEYAGDDEIGGEEELGSSEGGQPVTQDFFIDQIDQLRAEFEQMLDGLGLDQDKDGDHDSDDHAEQDFASDEEGEGEESEFGSDDEEQEESYVREYVENVGQNWDKSNPMRSEKNSPNTKSIVASKNDMGGTTANIARGGSDAGVEANKGQLKGSSLIKQTPQDLKSGNVNVPGSKTATKLSNVAKGHGAEKKGSDGGVSVKGPISGKVR